MTKSSNLGKLLDVPGDFEDQRGYDNNTTKTNATDQYYFQFGIGEFSSFLDQAARDLYEALGNEDATSRTQSDLLTHIEKYIESCLSLDEKIVWKTVSDTIQKQEQFNSQDLDE